MQLSKNSKQISARNVSRNNLSFQSTAFQTVLFHIHKVCSLCSNAKHLSVTIVGNVTTNWIHAEQSGLENDIWDSRCPLLPQSRHNWYRTENVYTVRGRRQCVQRWGTLIGTAGVGRLRVVDDPVVGLYCHRVASIAAAGRRRRPRRHSGHPTRRRTLPCVRRDCG